MIYYAPESTRGEIGIHARFRFWCRKVCGITMAKEKAMKRMQDIATVISVV